MWWSCWWLSYSINIISDWFVTSTIIKKLFTTLCSDDNIFYSNEDSGDAIFTCNEIGIDMMKWYRS